MCINSLMIDNDIIKCLIEDLLDRICLINSSSPIINSSMLYSPKFIESKFNESVNILNNSIRQLLTYELNTVVNNGQLTATSNIRHSRHYNPTTVNRQINDFKKRLDWIHQRQMILKQFNLNEDKKIDETNLDLNSSESVWFEHRFKMLDSSIELLKKQKEEEEKEKEKEKEENNDDLSCARCRIHHRKNDTNNQLLHKLKQIHNEHNYSIQYSTLESNLILSLSKIADGIGKKSNLNVPNSFKKVPLTTTKQKQPTKLQSSISLIANDSNKHNNKRTIEVSRNISNSNFISTNYDLTNKRHKRIASPQSTSTTTNNTTGMMNNLFSHEILTPSWRLLINDDFDNLLNQDEYEDISDENYIHRHIRCELEQESWIKNPSISKNVSLASNRKNSTFQTSLSMPNGLSTTNQKQYRYRLTSNGIAYTETINTK